jgi:subtilisin family serine protease
VTPRVHRALVTVAVTVAGLCVPAAAPGSIRAPLHPVIVVVAGDPMASAARPTVHGEMALRSAAAGSQTGLRTLLRAEAARGRAAEMRPLWVVNQIALKASDTLIRELRQRADVAAVVPDTPIRIALATAPATGAASISQNLEAIGAPKLWAGGATGAGTVVASLDTGADMTDPDLAGAYRGGPGAWFDPYGQQPVPADRHGHGTWTLGVMVGGADTGTAVGVAPGARWIAARIFDDSGQATVSGIHAAFQWALDPDGNPATDDRPDVVDAPWAFDAPGCNTTFLPDIQALRALGVLTVFAAGNAGPADDSDRSPANNPGAVSVGATDAADAVAAFSSRGPSSCIGSTFPTITAPGTNIPTTDRFGLATSESGTSMAAPQVAGGLALLLSAHPELTADQQEAALLAGAVDLGAPGADAAYGAGRLDVAASHAYLGGVSERRLLFADGFESGRLSAWDGRHGRGLRVSPAAALAGSLGLSVRGAEGPSAVVDRHAAARQRVRIDVELAARSADTSGRWDDVITAFGPSGQRLFALQLQSADGLARVRLLARTGSQMTASPTAVLVPGSHRMRISWSAGGVAELVLDSASAGVVSGMAPRSMGRIEAGWLPRQGTRTGELALDDFRVEG